MENTIVEALVKRAEENNVSFSKRQVEFMQEGLDNNRISEQGLSKFVDAVIEKHQAKGHSWLTPDESMNAPKDTVTVYGSSEDGMLAYICERTNKETQETFYACNRIQEKDGQKNHIQMMTHNDPDVIKDSVNKYFTQITANEVSREYLDKKNEIGTFPKDNQEVSKPVEKEPAGMEI